MIKACEICEEECDKRHDVEFLLSITKGEGNFCLMCDAQIELLEDQGKSIDCADCNYQCEDYLGRYDVL